MELWQAPPPPLYLPPHHILHYHRTRLECLTHLHYRRTG